MPRSGRHGNEAGTRIHLLPMSLGSELGAKLTDDAEDNTTSDDPCDFFTTLRPP